MSLRALGIGERRRGEQENKEGLLERRTQEQVVKASGYRG